MQMRKYIPKELSMFLFLTSFFCLGLLTGFLIWGGLAIDKDEQSKGYEIRQSGYRFINPLLECEVARDLIQVQALKSFKSKIQALIDEEIKGRMASHVSVYYRDLNNGPWFGINEKADFAPASLLKVPAMIACFKQAESDPKFLTRIVKNDVKEDRNAHQNIKSSETIKHGGSYTLDELIYRMIVYSDNNAMSLVLKNVNVDMLVRSYVDMGVNVPADEKEDFMSVKNYASFFRILFNASYLNKDMSEKALEYLANVDFRQGLVASVPPDVMVAHKLGERTMGTDNSIKQMHDCGIVYYPDHPYLLCVMTRGDSFERLDDTIRGISRLVFEEVSLQYNKQ